MGPQPNGDELKRSPLYRRTGLRKSPAPNFGAKPIHDFKTGRHHASKGEYQYWCHLENLERGGAIRGLKHQPKVTLIADKPTVTWRADASYIEDGREVWDDYKPRPFTPRENLLMKLWVHFGPGPLRIIGEKKGRFTTRKVVVPKEGGGK